MNYKVTLNRALKLFDFQCFVHQFFLVLVLVGIAFSCKDQAIEELVFAEAITGQWIRTDQDAVDINFRVEGVPNSVQSDLSFEFGVVWNTSEEEELDINGNKALIEGQGLENNTYTVSLEGLSVTNTYYFRAFVKIGDRIDYGAIDQFNLVEDDIYLLMDSSSVSNDQIFVKGIFGFEFGPIDDHGFIFSDSDVFPGYNSSNKLSLGAKDEIGPFFGLLTDLNFNQTYYIWPYANLNGENIHGNYIQAQTKGGWRSFAIIDNVVIRDPFVGKIGPKAIIGMGCDYSVCTLEDAPNFKSIWTFNPNNDQGLKDLPRVRPETSPIGRNGPLYFTTEDKIIYGLGRVSGDYLEDFWAYDPLTENWEILDSFPGVPRVDAIGIQLGNDYLIGSGTNKSGVFLSDFWLYQTTASKGNRWKKLDDGDLPAIFRGNTIARGRTKASIFKSNGKIYAGLGFSGIPLTDLWVFNEVSNSWEQGLSLDFPNPPQSLVAVAFEKSVYIGLSRNNTNNSWFEWESSNPQVLIPQTPFPEIEYPIEVNAGFENDGSIFIVGTNPNFFSTDIWQYVPEIQ